MDTTWIQHGYINNMDTTWIQHGYINNMDTTWIHKQVFFLFTAPERAT